MPRFYENNVVRVLRKRASPSQPDEIGIVVELLCAEGLHLVNVESWRNMGPAPDMYRVRTLENCPPDCPKEENYCEEELELISGCVSLDIYQFG
ncbi:MAG: hypothetical protein ACE5IE_02725 [Dehalococcoidia bacterium]